ncbi:MAG: hypothetical protein JST83_11540 [Bacteroidetes bacterium]|nr:hypothetical protein [Bacteroidota bacterium]
MSRQELKERIIDSMETADDSVLEAIYTLLHANNPSHYSITDDQLRVVEERREEYLSGKSTMHKWDEVKNKITQK